MVLAAEWYRTTPKKLAEMYLRRGLDNTADANPYLGAEFIKTADVRPLA